MLISGTPDQMRSQCTGRQIAPVGCQHLLFTDGLGLGVVTKPTLRIAHRLVDVLLRRAIESDARAARVNKLRHVVLSTPLDHVPGTQHVDAIEMLPRAPNSGNG